MSRHPYTNAADLIRHWAGYNSDGCGTKLSRSDAARITAGLAPILGMTKEDLCIRLSAFFMQHQEELAEEGAKAFLATQEEPQT